MSIRNIVAVIIALSVLAGCGISTNTPDPKPASAVLQVHLAPSLSFLEPILLECSSHSPEYTLSLVKQSHPLSDPKSPDVSIRWGIPHAEIKQTDDETMRYHLTDIELTFITHPSRIQTGVSPQLLTDIFQGRVQDWSDVSPDHDSETILPVMYPADHPLRNILRYAFLPHGSLSSNARIVPNQEAVVSIVSDHPGTIGLIAAPYQTDGVQVVPVSPRPDILTQPVWGTMSIRSNPQSTNLLNCVTLSLQN